MPRIQAHEYDPDSWDDLDEYATFEPVHRSTSRTPAKNAKVVRRQQEREWGRAINKFQKNRLRRDGKP